MDDFRWTLPKKYRIVNAKLVKVTFETTGIGHHTWSAHEQVNVSRLAG